MSTPLPDTCNGVACRLCVGGPSCADLDRTFDDTIDAWHTDTTSADALHERLGMTSSEYATFAVHGILPAAIRAATKGGDA